LVQMSVSGERGRASYFSKIDYGDLAAKVGDDIDGDIALQEAYLSYNTGPVAITAGRYPTPLGYESIEPWNNANISRSRAWTRLFPVSHDGLYLTGDVGIFELAIGAFNQIYLLDPAANDEDPDSKGVVSVVTANIGELRL